MVRGVVRDTRAITSKQSPSDSSCFILSKVAVLCKNQFYYFFALWPDNGAVAVDESDILDILQAIQKDADRIDLRERSQTALGVFTSLPRSQWAVARQELCATESNALALRMIDSALFVLVLDDYIAPDIHTAAANMLHGANVMDGTTQVGSCLNRWYDKLQLIVCGDGTSGLIFEHSIIDGHTALRFVSDTFAETVITFAESIIDLIHGRGRIAHVVNAVVERAVVANRSGTGRTLDVNPKKLVYELSESIVDQIYFAETALCDEIHASDTYVLEYKQFGKRFIVANNMSPDAMVQMSILLAYYKLYGKVDCMYEPALTKHFYHGRTEAIRGTTPQAKHFCEVWCRKKSTSEEKLKALRHAITEHSRLTKEASAGQGVDRLLFALKCIAMRINDGTVPPFFQSEAWKTLNHTVLSTSNCGNPALRLFGFGPVVPDGFGIGYIIKDNAISYSVCSKRRQTYRYVQSLERCLNEIQSLLQPISSVSVEPERPFRRDETGSEKTTSEESVSYGDIWGENDSVFVTPASQLRNETTTFPLPSRNPSFTSYSPRILEQSIRGDLLTVSSIDILFHGSETVADKTSSSPTASNER
jgi:carnitine O-acetyltransferase